MLRFIVPLSAQRLLPIGFCPAILSRLSRLSRPPMHPDIALDTLPAPIQRVLAKAREAIG